MFLAINSSLLEEPKNHRCCVDDNLYKFRTEEQENRRTGDRTQHQELEIQIQYLHESAEFFAQHCEIISIIKLFTEQ